MYVNYKELLRSLANDDQTALKQIIKLNKNNMYRVALGVLQNKELAQDVVQETFVKLWEVRKDLDLTAKLSTWLYRVTMNRAISVQRRNKLFWMFSHLNNKDVGKEVKKVSFEQQLMDNRNSLKTESIENKQIQEALKKAIDSLPKNQRLAFVLAKYEDLSYKEISEIMEITVSSVESLLFRAKQNLQKKLINVYKSLN